MDFRSIKITDKKDIDRCLSQNIFRTCDFSFTNLFAWQIQFETMFTIIEETLFIRFKDFDHSFTYMMPIGSLPLKESMEMILNDANEHHTPFRMKAVTKQMWKDLEEVMPDRFVYETDRDNYEYIYRAEKLINLSGKKLQSKRNHINRFKVDHPNWEYCPIKTKEDLAACASMLDEWENITHEVTPNSFTDDYYSAKCMINHFDELELKGGAIKVDGKVIAFTIGEQLTSDTFVVHVEKAFPDMNGAYTIINQQFIEHEAAHYKHINREEDLGLENLRKAKLSYQPEALLEEGVLKLK